MKPIEPDHSHTLQARDGTRLHVAHWRHPAPQGVAVFLHGLCAHGGWYGELAANLRAAGWALVAPDYRGHGLSEGPRAGLAKDDDLLHDVATVLDYVRAAYPGRRCILMGHSTGGLVASRFGLDDEAARRAGWARDVDALMLLAPAFLPTLSLTQKALLTTMGRLLLDVSLPVGVDPNWMCNDPATAQSLLSDPLMHGRITPRFALFLAREGERALELAPTLKVPTLMIYSKADKLVNFEGCERFAKQAPAALLATRAHDRLAHSLLLEPEKAQVHDEIVTWLSQRFPA